MIVKRHCGSNDAICSDHDDLFYDNAKGSERKRKRGEVGRYRKDSIEI